mmetsp:Transcript_111870/g.174750  ORF Transcript_111870/g.174750 Transcript_111870/m.174750 type:complete len:174 (-) Transcript_111870:472-993(-)
MPSYHMSRPLELRGVCTLLGLLLCHLAASAERTCALSDSMGAPLGSSSPRSLLQKSLLPRPTMAFEALRSKVGKTLAGVPVHNYDEGRRQLVSRDDVQEWLVKLKDGVSDQALNAFCVALPGNSQCLAQGHPSEGGIAVVVVRATEDIPMDAIPEVRGLQLCRQSQLHGDWTA